MDVAAAAHKRNPRGSWEQNIEPRAWVISWAYLCLARASASCRWGPTAAQVLGLPAAGAMGRRCLDLFAARDARHRERHRRVSQAIPQDHVRLHLEGAEEHVDAEERAQRTERQQDAARDLLPPPGGQDAAGDSHAESYNRKRHRAIEERARNHVRGGGADNEHLPAGEKPLLRLQCWSNRAECLGLRGHAQPPSTAVLRAGVYPALLR